MVQTGAAATHSAPELRPGLVFAVSDWSACSPGRCGKAAWQAERGLDDAPGVVPVAAVPAALRRRLSPVGRMVMQVVHELGGTAEARYVFCSRHGEIGRTLALLRSIEAGEPLSPTDFSLSVHNALGGLLSIAAGNRSAQTAVAAGADSFCHGMLEALATLWDQPAAPVTLVYFEDATPEFLLRLGDRAESAFVLALLLARPAPGQRCFRLSTAPRATLAGGPRAAAGQAMEFLRFMLTDAPALDQPGERLTWAWRRGLA